MKDVGFVECKCVCVGWSCVYHDDPQIPAFILLYVPSREPAVPHTHMGRGTGEGEGLVTFAEIVQPQLRRPHSYTPTAFTQLLDLLYFILRCCAQQILRMFTFST